jgi:hypothetical protein
MKTFSSAALDVALRYPASWKGVSYGMPADRPALVEPRGAGGLLGVTVNVGRAAPQKPPWPFRSATQRDLPLWRSTLKKAHILSSGLVRLEGLRRVRLSGVVDRTVGVRHHRGNRSRDSGSSAPADRNGRSQSHDERETDNHSHDQTHAATAPRAWCGCCGGHVGGEDDGGDDPRTARRISHRPAVRGVGGGDGGKAFTAAGTACVLGLPGASRARRRACIPRADAADQDAQQSEDSKHREPPQAHCTIAHSPADVIGRGHARPPM